MNCKEWRGSPHSEPVARPAQHCHLYSMSRIDMLALAWVSCQSDCNVP